MKVLITTDLYATSTNGVVTGYQKAEGGAVEGFGKVVEASRNAGKRTDANGKGENPEEISIRTQARRILRLAVDFSAKNIPSSDLEKTW